jgi:hypothetical protein
VKARTNAGTLGVTLDAAGMIEWRALIDHVRTEAEERIDGRDCYRVRLAPRNGSQDMIRWYDRDTGLLYRSALAVSTDMGPLPLVMTYEEYRSVAEVKWPSRIRVTASGQDTLFAADEVKLNEPVDDAVFEVPAEIRDLAQKKGRCRIGNALNAVHAATSRVFLLLEERGWETLKESPPPGQSLVCIGGAGGFACRSW